MFLFWISLMGFNCIFFSLLKQLYSNLLFDILVYKEEEDEIGREIEIGYPTDVKHVTHIGLDGTTMTNPIKDWENLKAPEIISFPSISLRQFEFAMAAQAHGSLVVDPSKLD